MKRIQTSDGTPVQTDRRQWKRQLIQSLHLFVGGNGQYKCLSDYEMEITKVDEAMREKLNVNDIDALKRDLMDIRSMFNKKVNELHLE